MFRIGIKLRDIAIKVSKGPECIMGNNRVHYKMTSPHITVTKTVQKDR